MPEPIARRGKTQFSNEEDLVAEVLHRRLEQVLQERGLCPLGT